MDLLVLLDAAGRHRSFGRREYPSPRGRARGASGGNRITRAHRGDRGEAALRIAVGTRDGFCRAQGGDHYGLHFIRPVPRRRTPAFFSVIEVAAFNRCWRYPECIGWCGDDILLLG